MAFWKRRKCGVIKKIIRGCQEREVGREEQVEHNHFFSQQKLSFKYFLRDTSDLTQNIRQEMALYITSRLKETWKVSMLVWQRTDTCPHLFPFILRSHAVCQKAEVCVWSSMWWWGSWQTLEEKRNISTQFFSSRFFFILDLSNFVCMSVLSVCISMPHVHAWWLPRSGVCVASPGTVVTECCELLCGCWRPNLWAL